VTDDATGVIDASGVTKAFGLRKARMSSPAAPRVCTENGHKSKSRLGRVSKIAQVALHQDLHTSSLKRTVDSDNQEFEG
jgi:hypothetical protein